MKIFEEEYKNIISQKHYLMKIITNIFQAIP